MRLLKAIDRVLGRVEEQGARAAGLVVVLVIILLSVEIILRKIFNASTMIADEYGGYGLVAITFLAAAGTLRTGGHITVDFVISKIPAGARLLVECGVWIVMIITSAIFLWATMILPMQSFKLGSRTGSAIDTMAGIPELLVPIGFAFVLLESLFGAYRAFSKLRE